MMMLVPKHDRLYGCVCTFVHVYMCMSACIHVYECMYVRIHTMWMCTSVSCFVCYNIL